MFKNVLQVQIVGIFLPYFSGKGGDARTLRQCLKEGNKRLFFSIFNSLVTSKVECRWAVKRVFIFKILHKRTKVEVCEQHKTKYVLDISYHIDLTDS